MSEPVAWIKDTSLIALKRDESTVMAYPHDYLIRPAVPLYTADAIREAVLAEREACLSACNKIATESKNYHAQGGAQACWYAIKARGGEA
jgi:hypothetical protein